MTKPISLFLALCLFLLIGCATGKIYQESHWEKESSAEALSAKNGQYAKPFDTVFNSICDMLEKDGIVVDIKDKANGRIRSDQFTQGALGMDFKYLVEAGLTQEQGYVQVKWKIYYISNIDGEKKLSGGEGPESIKKQNEQWNYRLYTFMTKSNSDPSKR